MQYRQKHLIAGERLKHQFLPERSRKYMLIEDYDAEPSHGTQLALDLQWMLCEGKINLCCFSPLR